MSVVSLFNGALSASFKATKALLIAGVDATFGFEITVVTAPAVIEWYLETGEAPSGPWFREIAEEDTGLGAIKMPEILRTFTDNGGSTLAVGAHFLDAEFKRRRPMVRIQMRLASGGPATVSVTAPFGTIAV
jgi:hypothetical protein